MSGFLRFSAKIFGFLRKSAVSCALQTLEFPGEGVNLRKSAVFCEKKNCVLGSLCHLGSLTFSAAQMFSVLFAVAAANAALLACANFPKCETAVADMRLKLWLSSLWWLPAECCST